MKNKEEHLFFTDNQSLSSLGKMSLVKVSENSVRNSENSIWNSGLNFCLNPYIFLEHNCR